MCFYLSQTFKRAGPCCDIIVSCSSKPECLTFFQLIQKQKFFLPCSSLCIYKERTIKLSCFIKMVHMTCMNFSKYFKAIFFFFYIYAFSRRFYPKRLTVHSGYTCFVSMCVPWESNPQPLRCKRNALTTEPQEHFHRNTSI